MSDGAFDVNEIAAVLRRLDQRRGDGERVNFTAWAAAIVAWLDSRLKQVGVLGEAFDGHPYLRPGRPVSLEVPVFRIVVQPEDQHG